MASSILAPGGASTHPQGSVLIAPRGNTWANVPIYSGDEFAHTRQAMWHRNRTQREHGQANEAHGYWLRLNYYDDTGRLWQHSALAVMDDFGTLVEVLHA